MLYLLLPLPLVIYFEFLGRWVSFRFSSLRLKLYFPLGFFSFLAVTYLFSFLTIGNVSFYVTAVLYLLLLAAGLFFIIRDFKKIDHSINLISVIVCILTAALFTYYSYNTTLGNLDGFDVTFYLNFVSENISAVRLNDFDVYLNAEKFASLTYYSGQTYFYFAGVVIWLYGKILSFINIEFLYMQAFIWIFQIIFNLCLSAVIVEAMADKEKKYLYIAIAVPVIFVFGKLYYNSSYGFFGNSYLTVVLAYVSLLMIRMYRSKDYSLRYLVYVMLFGSCAFSSSGIYSLLFVLFGMLFLADDKNRAIKETAVLAFIPLYNALSMERYPLYITIGLPLAVCAVIYSAGPSVSRFLQKRKLWPLFLGLCFILTFSLSRSVSNGLFDFSGLINTSSQVYDMTLDYFSFAHDGTLIRVYKILILVLLTANLIINYKDRYVMFIWALIIAFFNPFSCNIINDIVSVYYRSYSIFINPYTLFFFMELLYEKIRNTYVKWGISLAILAVFIVNINFIRPIYYHYQHEPSDGYNAIYKMNDDELDIIRQLKWQIEYNRDEYPYIVSSNTLTMSIIPEGKYLYGRLNIKHPKWTYAEKKLQEIFYEPEYLGDCLSKHPDYENMDSYIRKAGIDYLILNKDIEYYDTEGDFYYYLYEKVNVCTGIYPIYENDTYVMYHFNNN